MYNQGRNNYRNSYGESQSAMWTKNTNQGFHHGNVREEDTKRWTNGSSNTVVNMNAPVYDPNDKQLIHNKRTLYDPNHTILFENKIPPNDFLERNKLYDIGVGFNYKGSLLSYVMYYTYKPSMKKDAEGNFDYYFSVPDLKRIL
jgi:hypothetical protein